MILEVSLALIATVYSRFAYSSPELDYTTYSDYSQADEDDSIFNDFDSTIVDLDDMASEDPWIHSPLVNRS
jgi:hypothetical protein